MSVIVIHLFGSEDDEEGTIVSSPFVRESITRELPSKENRPTVVPHVEPQVVPVTPDSKR